MEACRSPVGEQNLRRCRPRPGPQFPQQWSAGPAPRAASAAGSGCKDPPRSSPASASGPHPPRPTGSSRRAAGRRWRRRRRGGWLHCAPPQSHPGTASGARPAPPRPPPPGMPQLALAWAGAPQAQASPSAAGDLESRLQSPPGTHCPSPSSGPKAPLGVLSSLNSRGRCSLRTQMERWQWRDDSHLLSAGAGGRTNGAGGYAGNPASPTREAGGCARAAGHGGNHRAGHLTPPWGRPTETPGGSGI